MSEKADEEGENHILEEKGRAPEEEFRRREGVDVSVKMQQFGAKKCDEGDSEEISACELPCVVEELARRCTQTLHGRATATEGIEELHGAAGKSQYLSRRTAWHHGLRAHPLKGGGTEMA